MKVTPPLNAEGLLILINANIGLTNEEDATLSNICILYILAVVESNARVDLLANT
jgi:hypothetical protein